MAGLVGDGGGAGPRRGAHQRLPGAPHDRHPARRRRRGAGGGSGPGRARRSRYLGRLLHGDGDDSGGGRRRAVLRAGTAHELGPVETGRRPAPPGARRRPRHRGGAWPGGLCARDPAGAGGGSAFRLGAHSPGSRAHGVDRGCSDADDTSAHRGDCGCRRGPGSRGPGVRRGEDARRGGGSRRRPGRATPHGCGATDPRRSVGACVCGAAVRRFSGPTRKEDRRMADRWGPGDPGVAPARGPRGAAGARAHPAAAAAVVGAAGAAGWTVAHRAAFGAVAQRVVGKCHRPAGPGDLLHRGTHDQSRHGAGGGGGGAPERGDQPGGLAGAGGDPRGDGAAGGRGRRRHVLPVPAA